MTRGLLHVRLGRVVIDAALQGDARFASRAPIESALAAAIEAALSARLGAGHAGPARGDGTGAVRAHGIPGAGPSGADGAGLHRAATAAPWAEVGAAVASAVAAQERGGSQ